MSHTGRRLLFSIVLAVIGGFALLGAHALFVLRTIRAADAVLAFAVSVIVQVIAWFARRTGADPA